MGTRYIEVYHHQEGDNGGLALPGAPLSALSAATAQAQVQAQAPTPQGAAAQAVVQMGATPQSTAAKTPVMVPTNSPASAGYPGGITPAAAALDAIAGSTRSPVLPRAVGQPEAD